MGENEALARRLITEVLDGQRVDLVDELIAPDHVNRRADGTEQGGLAARKASAAAWHGAFPDYHHEIEDVIADGDMVAVRFTATGT